MPESMAAQLRTAAIVLLAGAATAGLNGQAAAQNRVELIPTIGSFLPLADWGHLDQNSADSGFRQTIGVLAGGRLRLEFNDLFGLEASALLVNTGWIEDRVAKTTSAFDQVGLSLKGRLTVASMRLTYRPQGTNFYVLGGAAYMSRSGKAWDESLISEFSAQPTVFEKTNVAGLAGLGLRAAVSRSLSVDITAEVYLHGTDRVTEGFAFPNSTYESGGFQQDLIVTVGIPFGLARR